MLRKLVAALLGVGVMVPGVVQAFGLGTIKLNSALSEPLDAEIALLQVRELSDDEIQPSMASNADFAAAGIEKFHFLNEMKFNVVVNPNGRSYIKVTSRKPMKEPFVNFLVEVHWPEGRLLREYTLLLDPPTYRTQAAPVVKSPTSAARQTTPVRSSAVNPSPVSANSSASGNATAGTFGPTGPSDSLWSIAIELKPSSRVNVHQTMMAIQRLNPEAFVNGNINLLKRGQVLRAPTEAEVLELSPQDAIRQVSEQNRAWKEKRTLPAAPGKSPVDTAGARAEEAVAAVQPQNGKLSLVTPTKNDAAQASAQSGESSSNGGEYRDKLALAEEATDQFKLENENLKLKLNDLQVQTDTINQVIKLKDDQIAAMQAKMLELEEQLKQIKQVEKVADVEPSPVEPASTSVVEATQAASVPVTEQPADTAQAVHDFNYQADEAPVETGDSIPRPISEGEGVVGEITKPVLLEPMKPVQSSSTERVRSIPEEILANWFYMLGIAGLGILGAAGVAHSRRGKADESHQIVADTKSTAGRPSRLHVPVSQPQQPTLPKQDDAKRAVSKQAGANHTATNPVESPQSVSLQAVTPASPQELNPGMATPSVKPRQPKVLEDVDTYIAFGRFNQAIDMLEKARAAEPQNDDILLKLLWVALETKNVELFDRHASVIVSNGNVGNIARMEALRRKLPVQPVSETLAEPVFAPQARSVPGQDRVDIQPADDLEFEPKSSFGFQDAGARIATPMVSGLDFALDLKLVDAPEQKTPAPDIPLVAEDTSLDFDLEIDLDKEFGDIGHTRPDRLVSKSDLEDQSLELVGEFDFTESSDNDTSIDEYSFEPSPRFSAPAQPAISDTLLPGASRNPTTSLVDTDVRRAMDFENEQTIDSNSAALLAEELDFPTVDTGSSLRQVSQSLSGSNSDLLASEVSSLKLPESGIREDDYDFMTDSDETATKLDLARAYIDMGDLEGARDILDEVLVRGTPDQQGDARNLLKRIE